MLVDESRFKAGSHTTSGGTNHKNHSTDNLRFLSLGSDHLSDQQKKKSSHIYLKQVNSQ